MRTFSNDRQDAAFRSYVRVRYCSPGGMRLGGMAASGGQAVAEGVADQLAAVA
jgi:hypothetical protein